MRTFITSRRVIALGVMIAFFLLIRAGAQPTPSTGEDKADRETAAASASNDSPNPGAIEKIGGGKATAKKKGFPWLIVAGGIVVVGVVLYFTVFKKPKYNLTVAVGQGVEGSPATGTYTHKKGTTVAYNYTPKSGYMTPSVKLDGSNVAATGSVTMNGDHTLEVNAAEGLHDDFDSAASPLWAPYQASEWIVSGGKYFNHTNRFIGKGYNLNYNVFNHRLSQTTFTVTVRMQRLLFWAESAILLATDNNMQTANGFLFSINLDGDYQLARCSNYNLVDVTGSLSYKCAWTSHEALLSGLGAWNTVKIVRTESSYSLILNDVLATTFTDAAIDPRYLVLTNFVGSNFPSEMIYDFVYVNVGSAPALAASPFPVLLAPPSGKAGFKGKRTSQR